MTDEASSGGQDLDTAIASIYRGPMEEFVARRDALVKELRAADRRDDANTVKGLRKPSRTAWALDAVALDDPATVEGLAAALADAIEAQSSGGDLRGAFDQLRATVRGVSAVAVQIAVGEGHSVDQAGLVPALSAVVTDSEAFGALRAGRLATIPAGGGVDLLTNLEHVTPAPPKVSRAAGAAPGTAQRSDRKDADEEVEPGLTEVAEAARKDQERKEAAAAARHALLEAEASANIARERAMATERALSKAEINAEVADEQLRLAERTAQARRTELDQARREAQAAKAREREADAAAAQARAEIDRLP